MNNLSKLTKMNGVNLICFTLCFFIGTILCIAEGENKDVNQTINTSLELSSLVILKDKPWKRTSNGMEDDDCWMKFSAPELFIVMKNLDRKYLSARTQAQSYIKNNNFDDNMLKTMISNRGAANQEITEEKFNHAKIPAGLHLGGLCMTRLPDSVLFFHRMKLRNNTFFRINVLQNDIKNMVLRMQLSLNDLHLKGAYERTMTDRDPSVLIYAPSFGELEILLKDVQYDVKARYRLIKERLVVEVIISKLHPQDIILSHPNETTDHTMRIQKDNLGDFMARLKTDLNKWLQDYLNDFLIYINLDQVPQINNLQKYDKEKAAQLATFMDNSIIIIRKKLRAIGGSTIQVPQFSIVATHGLKIKIFDGTLQGLDTMYRRSVATTILKRDNFRYVNSIIGFSDLKVVYKYEIIFSIRAPVPPALTGLIILSANDLTGHLALGLLKDPEVVELDIDFMNQLGPYSLTVEGAANLLISNFKHLLRLQILTIMSNTLIYGVGMLRSLPRCQPFVPGQLKKRRIPEIVKINKPSLRLESSSQIDTNELKSEYSENIGSKSNTHGSHIMKISNGQRVLPQQKKRSRKSKYEYSSKHISTGTPISSK